MPVKLLISLMLIIAFCVATDAAETTPSAVTVEDVMKIENLVECQISPDGNRVVHVIARNDPNNDCFNFSLFYSEVGGNHTQLTTGPADFCPRFAPDSQRIAFLSQRDGHDQICMMKLPNREVKCLTEVQQPIENFNWSPNGRLIAFLSPQGSRNSPSQEFEIKRASQHVSGNQVFILDMETGSTEQVTHIPGEVTGFSWSPDSKRIVASIQPSASKNDHLEQDIYIIDLDSYRLTPLVVRDGKDTMPEWSLDGEKIAFQSTCGPATCFARNFLCVIDVDGAPFTLLSKDRAGIFPVDDFEAMDWDCDSQSLFVTKAVGLESHLYRLDLNSGAMDQLTQAGSVYTGFSFSRNRKRMAFKRASTKKTGSLFISDVSLFKPECIHSLNNYLEDRTLGEAERFSWTGTDGLKLEGVLVKPVGVQPGIRYPLVTYLHGGPPDMFKLAFGPYCLSAEQMEFLPVQVLAAKGYAVFCPNPRGSQGRGWEFRELARMDWGTGPFQDVMSGIDALETAGIADPNRLAIGGHCYGGYLTAWAISHTDRFRVAMAGACISNLTSQFGLSDIPGINVDYFGGTPWEKPDAYSDNSPLNHIQNIKTPILLHHGEMDERVPVTQGQEYFRALAMRNISTELYIYPQAGHVQGQPSQLKHQMLTNLEWLKKWMQSPPVK